MLRIQHLFTFLILAFMRSFCFFLSHRGHQQQRLLQSLSYEFIDCGAKQRLESFGGILVQRSCPAALGKTSSALRWKNIDLLYQGSSGKIGKWENINDRELNNWSVSFGPKMIFSLNCSDMGQVGVFPEQQTNWKWITSRLEASIRNGKKGLNVLNGFAYTGGSTMAALSSLAALNIEVSYTVNTK